MRNLLQEADYIFNNNNRQPLNRQIARYSVPFVYRASMAHESAPEIYLRSSRIVHQFLRSEELDFAFPAHGKTRRLSKALEDGKIRVRLHGVNCGHIRDGLK